MHATAKGILGAAMFSMVAACGSDATRLPADLILTGGAVRALDGWAEAVAVREGLVVAVGNAEAMDGLRGPATRVIELDGAAVFPGLNDTHAHAAFAGREHFQPCSVPTAPWTAILSALAACVEATAPDEWIITGPIENSLLGAETTRHALDVVAPEHRILLYVVGGHAVVASSRALETAGIDSSTPEPPGGAIERDSTGEPTGVLLEPWSLLTPVLPPPDLEALASGITWALDQFLAVGVTSVTDANTSLPALQAYVGLADTGRLKARVRPCLLWEPTADAVDSLLDGGYARELVDARCVKIFVDGETATGRTASLLEPYQPADGSTSDDRGHLTLSPEMLTVAVTRFDAAGLTMKFHTWGDGAVDAALTAVEAARSANGFSGIRHEVGHVMLARAEDILRAKESGAILEFSPSIWVPPAMPIVGKDIGEPRMARAWPVHDALVAGTPAVAGTDWPAGPPGPYSPWSAIETLVTRLVPGLETGEPFAPSQRVTLEQAIALFTTYPAAHSSAADAPGIIAPGRKADLVVLDRNPFEIPITEINLTKAVITIVGGRVVYETPGSQ
jgi:predicted amidohydrolase YtcJ